MASFLLAGATAAALISVPAVAQTPQRGQARTMTLADMRARVQAQFAGADTNRDGYVTQAEVRASELRINEKRFARLDTNNDGRLSLAEMSTRLERRFHRLDTNGDGVMTRQERRSGRDQRQTRPSG